MPKISTIFEQDTDDGKTGVLGIDEDAQLYWNGRLVITDRHIKLDWWVNASVIISGLSTAIMAILSAISYFKL